MELNGTKLDDLARRIAGLTPEQRALFLERMARQRPAPGAGSGARIPRLPREGGSFPLSFAQRRIWFAEDLSPRPELSNESMLARLRGPFDPAALERALGLLAARHEALRTRFEIAAGEPVQILETSVRAAAPVIDLSALPEPRRGEEARRRMEAEIRRPFDRARAPLLRAAVLRSGAEDHHLILVLHHLICDGSSFGVLLRDLAVAYGAALAGTAPSWPPLPVRYVDYAEWQRGRHERGELAPQLEFWKQRLAGAPPLLEIPADRPWPARPTFRGAARVLLLTPEVTAGLKALRREQEGTLFMQLVAGLALLLARYTGREDLCLGSVVADRSHPDTAGLAGCLINDLVLRVDLAGNPGFGEAVGRVRRTALEAFSHLDLPFDRLIEALRPERTPNRTPFFQVVANQRDNPLAGLGLPGCEMEILADVHDGNSPFDLTMEMGVEHGGRQLLFFEYATDLFDAPTVERLLGHYGNLLAAAVEDPRRPLDALPLLGREEVRHLLSDGGAAAPLEPAAGPFFHERLEIWAEETPGATAVIYRDEAAGVETALTWRQLRDRARGVAAALRRAGAGPDVPVAVFLDRSAEIAVAFFGVLAAGGAYLPLDPALPPARLAFLLADAGAPVVLTERSRLAELSAAFPPGLPAPRLLFLEEIQAAAAPPEPPVSPDQLAYVIYTSGSTGRPKGVQVTHRGLRGFARSVLDAFGIGAGHRVLQLSSLAFDASILEMAMAWAGGGTLCLAPREDLLPGPALPARLAAWGITHLAISPSALAELEETPLPALEAVVAVAEAFSGELVERWGKGRSFFNAYGPTEGTVWASLARCRSGAARPPIGRPVTGARLAVTDRSGLLLPAGVPGELRVGGEGVSRGYRGRPGLTAERFVPDPWAGAPGARAYRTGDLVRWLPGGELEFLGRVDLQVKIRGHRVEPEEIEAVLEEHPAVRRAAVRPCRSASGEVFLAAWAASEEDPAVLREHLRSRLPAAMVPATLQCLEALPLSASGKVDRKALPAPEWTAPAAVFTPPQTEDEERLAALWRQLLGREQVGIDDNFFDLGGHSLLLVRMHTALRQELRIDLPITDLFHHPTIRALAGHLRNGGGEQDTAARERSRDRAQKAREALRQPDRRAEILAQRRARLGASS